MKTQHIKIFASFFIILFLPCDRQSYASPSTFSAANRSEGQGQQGLSPDKKKTLSNYGPEDVFPGEQPEQGQQGNRTRDLRPANRQSSGSRPTPTPIEISTPSPTPTPAAVLINAVSDPATPAPASTVPVDARNIQGQGPSNTANDDPPPWLLPGLAALTILVFASLVFVLYRLTLKVRNIYR